MIKIHLLLSSIESIIAIEFKTQHIPILALCWSDEGMVSCTLFKTQKNIFC